MKNSLLIVLFVLINATSFGQRIRFSDSTNTWTTLTTYPRGVGLGTGQVLSYSSYTGSVFIGGQKYMILDSIFYVREDTIAKKVFLRVHNTTIGQVDTADRLLYDYNLHIGDIATNVQLYTSTDTSRALVTNIDSTKINGIWYKVWHFTGTLRGLSSYYNVVEGIGCAQSFSFPLAIPDPVGNYQLQCFYNNGLQYPLSNPVLTYGPWYATTMNFQNNTTCPVLSVPAMPTNKNNAVVFPNPIDQTSKIVFPSAITSGTLVIINSIGQQIINLPFQNKDELVIGDKIKVPGVYFYRVTDIEKMQVFSGKIVY